MPKVVKLTGQEVQERAAQFFTPLKYSVTSQTDSMMVLTGGKDIDMLIFIILLCCGLIFGLVYYFLSKDKVITLTYTQTKEGTRINAVGSCGHAQADAEQFFNSL